jgi:hypothetical protein
MKILAVFIATLDLNMYAPLRIKWTLYANMTVQFSPLYTIGKQIVKNVLLHA